MDPIVYFLACLGATQIICHSKLFKPAREFIVSSRWVSWIPIKCPMCMGFWVGVAMRVLLWAGAGVLTKIGFVRGVVTLFIYGCASSAVSYAGCMLVNDDGWRIAKASPSPPAVPSAGESGASKSSRSKSLRPYGRPIPRSF